MSSEQSSDEVKQASEGITVSELLAHCGSANHDTNETTIQDALDALGEAHPAVAGNLVAHLRRAIDRSTESDRGTASGSEHPEWHDHLRLAKEQSYEEGYDV
ncbi:hypothetical protein [Natronocalculus amylovorans]|uniref:Uncharacterized protein n=1 Tax=Natronocalculus amylovorans TaxID=2917812 RepID=A0AAE3FZT2_9EURY|nr:hypothetical protein [Natronocalculus amylovorans]MCL9818349.1 hypothetical protein [Natronocalculus amylovorans]